MDIHKRIERAKTDPRLTGFRKLYKKVKYATIHDSRFSIRIKQYKILWNQLPKSLNLYRKQHSLLATIDEQGKLYPRRPMHELDQPTRLELWQILQDLREDPIKAVIKYGHETGVCCVCSRELTDPASVKAGIGPVCAGKLGYEIQADGTLAPVTQPVQLNLEDILKG